MKHILIYLILSFFWSCNGSWSNEIEVFFASRDMHVSNPLSCMALEVEFGDVLQHKTLDNDTLQSELFKRVKMLKKAEKESIFDARAIILFPNNNKIDTLCIGGHFGIILNGQEMEDDPELVKLIWAEIESVSN
ncbi:hypothetical protein WJR50_08355 [Catalinimonas sp. 4WD22]|uniref:hypothetical protein n=1 Tax=Catalinimonas locisalis TaxID=3133978 RepID=UPI0031013987